MPFPAGSVPPFPGNPPTPGFIPGNGYQFGGLFSQQGTPAFSMGNMLASSGGDFHLKSLDDSSASVSDHPCGPNTFPFGSASCPTGELYPHNGVGDLLDAEATWTKLRTLDPPPDFFLLFVSAIFHVEAYTDGCNVDPSVKQCGPGVEASWTHPEWDFAGGLYVPSSTSWEGTREVNSGFLNEPYDGGWAFVSSSTIEFMGFLAPPGGGAYQGDPGPTPGSGGGADHAYLLWPWSAVTTPLVWSFELMSRGYSPGLVGGELSGVSFAVQPFWLSPPSAPYEVPAGVLPPF